MAEIKTDKQKSLFWSWVFPVCFGLFWVVAAVILLITYAEENRFVNGELRGWGETTATIEDAWITKEEIGTPDDDGDRRYRVEYAYIIAFKTETETVRYEGTAANSGYTGSTAIPKSAYDIYEPGERVSVVYNPLNPGEYRFGTRAEITANARSPLLPIVATVCAALGVFILVACVRGIRREKRKRAEGAADPNEAIHKEET